MINSSEKFISYALNLSRRNAGITAPNPVVGCVIVIGDEIIATGVTAKGGRPHAEDIAIGRAMKKNVDLKKATLYVTLEPCCHIGVTPPCVNKIIETGIKKVVIATVDPDQRVSGKGIEILRKAGIEVVTGIGEKTAQEINRGFFKARLSLRPFVTLKLATSLDGKIATKSGDSKWITSESARQFSHHLRANHDAILVGMNTVRIDNPTLDCRITGLENYSPVRVIIAGKSDFDSSAKVFLEGPPTLVFTSLNLGKKFGNNVEVIFCQEKEGKIDFLEVLAILAKRGINSLLIEGGKEISTQFLTQKLVDEIVWIRGNKVLGGDAISVIGDLHHDKISEVINLERKEVIEMDGGRVEVFRVDKTQNG